jgi:uncharacterized membrane protein
MSRFDFMRNLEALLTDIPIEERNEAMKYYSDYFDDAGEENVDQIISELGTPERIAGIIKADLKAEGSNNQERGIFTEKGYKDTVYEDKKYEVVKPGEEKQQKSNGQQNRTYANNNYANNNYTNNTNSTNTNGTSTNGTNTNKIALIILICIFAIPVGIPAFFSIFGIAIAVIVTIFSLLLAFGIAGIVMIPSGVAMIFVGLVKLSIPFVGVSLCGGGLVLIGLGILFILLSTVLCKTVLPAIVRGIVYICRLPLRTRGVSA